MHINTYKLFSTPEVWYMQGWSWPYQYQIWGRRGGSAQKRRWYEEMVLPKGAGGGPEVWYAQAANSGETWSPGLGATGPKLRGNRFPRLQYWRGTAKRLIRINWIDIGGVQTIHRFGHQSGRGERSGGLSAAKIHDFSARVFLNRSQTSKNNKNNTKNKARHSKYRSGHPKLIFWRLFKDIFLEVRNEKWSSGSDLFG